MTLAQLMALIEMDPELRALKPIKEEGTMEDLMMLAQMPFGG